jgi:pyruvate dehydrogenase E2 component (dihydrolipoamide acetyltransferase)
VPTEIVMPNLGFDAKEARLVEWLKEPGDTVSRGEAIALVESDKADVELESVAEGVLLERLVEEDTVVDVGSVIARVGSAGEEPGETDSSAVPADTDAAASAGTAQEPAGGTEEGGDTPSRRGVTAGDAVKPHLDADAPNGRDVSTSGSVKALPKVRKRARELGVTLSALTPGGAGGVITMQDVEAAAGAGSPEARGGEHASSGPARPTGPSRGESTGESTPLSRTRKVIAERMTQSMQEAPHFYVSGELDVGDALTRLPATARVNDLLLYVTTRALSRVPAVNATFDGSVIHRAAGVDLSIAVATEEGLLTPTLPGADTLTFEDLAGQSRSLIERARANRLKREDLKPGTFTISNLGINKLVDTFTAVINPPQVAILAAGAVKQRPVAREGGLHLRHTVHLTMSGDHRVVDGMDLARFLEAFQDELDRFGGGERSGGVGPSAETGDINT